MCAVEVEVLREIEEKINPRVAIYEGECGNANELPTLTDKYGNDFGRGLIGKDPQRSMSTRFTFGEVVIGTFTWNAPLLLTNGIYTICYCEEDESGTRCKQQGEMRMKPFNVKVGTLQIDGALVEQGGLEEKRKENEWNVEDLLDKCI